MPPKPNLVTPGELLVAARTEAGLSLAEVEERTKITRPVLEAIEKDAYHKVTGELYVKSFLRTYAVDVGLDPDEILQLYSQFSGEATGGGPGGLAEEWTEEVQITRIGLPWARITLLMALVLILVGVIIIFWIKDTDGGDEAPAEANIVTEAVTPVVVETVEPETAPAVAKAAEDSLVPFGRRDEVAERESAPAETVTPDEVATTPAVNPAATPAATPTAGGAPAIPATEQIAFADGREWPLILRIVCQQKQSLGVRRDAEREYRPAQWPAGSTPAENLVPQQIVTGRAYATGEGLVLYWGARDHFSLRLGDVTGVEVSVNGAVQDLSGLRPGQEMLLDARSARR